MSRRPATRKAYNVAGLDVNRVFLNVSRWVRGAAPYVGDLTAYRVYMINHEDGHALGHNHAHQCLADGLAPAMMQQTFGLKSAVTGDELPGQPVAVPAGRERRTGRGTARHRAERRVQPAGLTRSGSRSPSRCSASMSQYRHEQQVLAGRVRTP